MVSESVIKRTAVYTGLANSRGSWVKCRGSWVKSRGSWVKSRGSRIKSRGSREKSRGSRIRSRGPEKMPWVPNKIFPYIYLSPFGFGMRVFFLLRLSQIYIVLERVKAGLHCGI